jgi:hypothetical protein
MSTTFDDLIRQPRQTVKKSRGGIISEPVPWAETSPFADIVLEGVRRRFQSQRRPEYRGVRKLDRKPTFTDLVIGASRGLDVIEKSAYDDWQTEDLSGIVDDFLAFLDST